MLRSNALYWIFWLVFISSGYTALQALVLYIHFDLKDDLIKRLGEQCSNPACPRFYNIEVSDVQSISR